MLQGYSQLIFEGALVTLELALSSVVLAVVIGLIGAGGKLSHNPFISGLFGAYTTLIRGVPDLVLMLLIFYGLQIALNNITTLLGFAQIDIDPLGAGIITLGFIYGAYFTETFRGAYLAVPKGQIEAATAYGFSGAQIFRRILFPAMMRFALPGIGNNWQVILKATALVSILGLNDVVKATQLAGKGTYQPFFFAIVAGVVYLIFTTVSNGYWQSLLWSDGYRFTGVAVTLWLLIASVVMGGLLAIPMAVARVSSIRWVRFPVWLYTYVFRGTPLYVQLLVFYSGMYSLEIVRGSEFLNAFFRSGLNCTILALTLNTCAYTTEIFAGAIRSVPHGEIEAANAYGFSRFKMYRCIILPSALRTALPAYSNEVILMLHSTALAFTATVPDLLKIARDINAATYQPFYAFGIAAVLYLIISYVLISLFRKAEKRWMAHVSH
ncbi:hypothetical protein KR044_013005 [Drosophila immigrans]|nr:hypothetical protein KR044_013005 [Drosophila immigrans]